MRELKDIGNMQDILTGFDRAIKATENSRFIFGKASKLKKLRAYRDEFKNNQDIEHLINFITESKRNRSIFGRKTSSFASLESYFSTNSVMKLIIDYIAKKFDTNNKSEIKKYILENYTEDSKEEVYSDTTDTTSVTSESSQESDQIFVDIKTSETEDRQQIHGDDDQKDTADGSQEFYANELQNKIVQQNPSDADSTKPTMTPKQHNKSSSKISKTQDPIKEIDPENISSLADMAKKIKFIQQDTIREILRKRYGEKQKKIKVKLQELKATPEQFLIIKQKLVEAGLLTEGKQTRVMFTDEDQLRETSAIEKAAELLKHENLLNLGYEKEMGIAQYQHKRIQLKSQEKEIIMDVYNKSLPEDEGFIQRCVQNMREGLVDLSSLIYSRFYEPFTEAHFRDILKLGLTDAQKINQICGDILNIDTKTLLEKINNGYFMSKNLSKDKIKDFVIELKKRLETIGWSFERLLNEKETLERDGLKLDLKLIESSQEEQAQSAAQNDIPKKDKQAPGFLAQITARKSAEESAVQAKSQTPKPLNPMQAALMQSIASKAKVVPNPSPSQQNELDISHTAPIKVKKTPSTGSQTLPQSFADKQAALLGVTGAMAKSSTPPASPDLSGRNKITVLSKNPELIKLIGSYLEELFHLTKSETDTGFDFTISKSKTKIENIDEIKKILKNMAELLEAENYSPFQSLFKIDKYQVAFNNAITKKDTVVITYNENYSLKRDSFEKLLNESRVLFVRNGNKYTINSADLNNSLLAKLRVNQFFSDYFIVTNKAKQQSINEQLSRSSPIVKFELHIPTQEMKDQFQRILNAKFGSDNDFYLDCSKFMVINSNKKQQFIECLDELKKTSNFSGEYIITKDRSFYELIQERFSYRLKISVSKSNDNLTQLLENRLNSRFEDEDSVTYYVDLSTLTNKKAVFFKLAAENRCEIEYYDRDKIIYQSIELAQDSQFNSSVTNPRSSKLGMFANSEQNHIAQEQTTTPSPKK